MRTSSSSTASERIEISLSFSNSGVDAVIQALARPVRSEWVCVAAAHGKARVVAAHFVEPASLATDADGVACSLSRELPPGPAEDATEAGNGAEAHADGGEPPSAKRPRC